MKIKYTKMLKDGRRHILVELSKGECEPVSPINIDGFYKLNYPMDDTIIAGHILSNPQRTAWDSYSQKWVDA
jgi:hypothetical protein